MIPKSKFNILFVLSIICFCTLQVSAQKLYDYGERIQKDSLSYTALRYSTSISISGGVALLNSDVGDPDFENFISLRFQQAITPSFFVNAEVKKFNLEDFDSETEGFLSGNINLGWLILPKEKISPYIFLGAGILSPNDFEDPNYKGQGGLGVDVLISDFIALFAAVDANYIINQKNDSFNLIDQSNDLFYNASIGVAFYFGRQQKSRSGLYRKNKKDNASTIENNTIDSGN